MAKPKLNRCQLDKQAESKVVLAYCGLGRWETMVSCAHYVAKKNDNGECKCNSGWRGLCKSKDAQANAAAALIKQLKEKYLT